MKIQKLKSLVFYMVLLLAIPIYGQYDIVFTGGRVMDPASGTDAVMNVGILGDKIAAVTSASINGNIMIDITGKVLAPGFIDPHVHGMTNDAHRYQVRDGVTTALELEGGIPFYGLWLEAKAGNSIVNFGGSVPHGNIRAMVMETYKPYAEQAERIIAEEWLQSLNLQKVIMNMQRSGYESLNNQELEDLNSKIETYFK